MDETFETVDKKTILEMFDKATESGEEIYARIQKVDGAYIGRVWIPTDEVYNPIKPNTDQTCLRPSDLLAATSVTSTE